MGEAIEQLTLEDEIRNENRIVQGWLLGYRQRKEEYCRRRGDILLASPLPPNGLPRGSETSDPTERKGGMLAELAEDEALWLELVEEVQVRLSWKMQIILKLRREAVYIRGKRRGRPAWVAYVHVKYCEEVAAKLGKQLEDVWVNNEDVFSEWWKRIVEYTARLAAKRGLLK